MGNWAIKITSTDGYQCETLINLWILIFNFIINRLVHTLSILCMYPTLNIGNFSQNYNKWGKNVFKCNVIIIAIQ